MTKNKFLSAVLATSAGLAISSCGNAGTGENVAASASSSPEASQPSETVGPFAVRDLGRFDEPWAAAFVPGTPIMVITEKAEALEGYDTQTGERWEIAGAPTVDYGGQGGLGDVAFLDSEELLRQSLLKTTAMQQISG